MAKKVFFCLLVLFVCFTSVFAKKTIDEKDVENMESWKESFDISAKQPGKYNVFITAEDQGGNTTIEGPHNIYIDPESDLPISGITNPRNNMRVPGNLNIVGTCIDDDAVERVEIILDGDTENPLVATGKDFWSYYLDTTQMSEGAHTISVYGIDINGKVGHEKTVTWHLDRRQPQTVIESHQMGDLVAKKINITGTVSDGNGIASVEYSLDGRETYKKAKIKTDKAGTSCTFSVPINTKDLPDGGVVLWFRAYDKQGTRGLFSFLFFVDNTSPNIKIISPEPKESVNGIFTVTGFAKDVIGLESLSWQFGQETGNFELLKGNPYWSLELDAKKVLGNSQELIITAVDTIGNISTKKQKILIDPIADLATINLETPQELQAFKDDVYIRGSATDDDGIDSIYWSVDGGEVYKVETDGSFYENITKKMSLPKGNHSVTIYAQDIHGLNGTPKTVNFTVPGKVPSFEKITVYKGTKENTDVDYQDGIELNPEYNAELKFDIDSESGLKNVTYQFTDMPPVTIDMLGKAGLSTAKIPVGNCKWGFTEVKVEATDIYDRKTEKSAFIYVTNLTKTRGEPEVVFSDNTVAQDGFIDMAAAQIVTGFFMGGKAAKVRFQPPTTFADVKLEGNVIRIVPNKDAVGVSDAVHVIVTTDKGIEYSSKTLHLKTKIPAPIIDLDKSGVLNGRETITIKGKITPAADLTVKALSYRVLHKDGNGSWKRVRYDVRTNEFTASLPSSTFADGVSVVEFRAVDSQNQDSFTAVFVDKVPPAPVAEEPGKKAPPLPAPAIAWLDGKYCYYTVSYSAEATLNYVKLAGSTLSECSNLMAGMIPPEKMKPGKNALEISVNDVNGKTYKALHNFNKSGKLDIYLQSVNNVPYTSGMEVVVPGPGSTEVAPSLLVSVKSELPVSAVYYSIDGGEERKVSEIKTVGTDSYQAYLSLSGFPAEQTRFSVKVETNDGNFTGTAGTITVIRTRDPSLINDDEKIYWSELLKNEEGFVCLGVNESISGFANLKTPIKVRFQNEVNGLDVNVNGKNIVITGKNPGIYKDVVVVAQDKEGISYTSSPISFIVDSDNPVVEITSPSNYAYVQDLVQLKGKVIDSVGILSAEYSLDNGNNWIKFDVNDIGSVDFDIPLDFTETPEGIIPIDVRVQDRTRKSHTERLVVFKDVSAPQVTVLVPCKEDKVNGETLTVFKIIDNGKASQVFYNAEGGDVELPMKQYLSTFVGNTEKPLSQEMQFTFTDKAGNKLELKDWEFIVDQESDLPVPEIHVPSDNEIIQNDFVISGVVIDDDGESKIYYKIDDGNYIEVEGFGTSFSIPVPLKSMTDNEHTVTVYAEDIYGIRSKTVVRPFRISLEEPKGAVELPDINQTVNGMVLVSGWASDKNGISKVQVSIDNGVTFNEVAGTEKWTYEFDTRVIEDGTHAIFIKVWDGYNIQGIYSSLINVDNTAPEINLELPIDGSKTTKMLFFSGQTTDNIGLKKLTANISSLDLRQKAVPTELAQMEFVPEEIITKTIDLSGLADGFYNIELVGEDAGGNVTRVSRNVELSKESDGAKIDILTPLNGEYLQGMFNLYGTVVTEKPFETIVLYVDGQEAAVTEVSPTGYFKFTLSPTNLSSGSHVLQVRGLLNDKVISSNETFIIYQPQGPWITIDNFTYGDFAFERPYIEGSSGYAFTESEILALRDKKTPKEEKERLERKEVSYLEISFDNGKTFTLLGNTKKWRYRVENEDMPAGYHFMIVRAVMKNGETAVTRCIIQIDKEKPFIKLIAPLPGGAFNETLNFAGLTSDDVNLKNVKVTLRSGDKASYEVPSFIQGLYFDWHFLGATMFDVGLGLTFFDDNVKLQGQFGQMTQSQYEMLCNWGGHEITPFRYGGNVVGAKLLANIAYIPFRFFFGPDWDWLSANFTLGANFSRFSETQSGKAQFLSAVVGQLEFPRVTIPKQKMFRTFSFYTEFQLWFIPTDVEVPETATEEIPSIVPQVSAGLRINVF